MFNSSWRTMLVLCIVVLVALSSGIYFRGIILKDFRSSLEVERIGGLEKKFLSPVKEELFINRSGKLLLAWSIFMAGLALGAGVLISRTSVVSAGKPELAAASDNNAVLNEGLPIPVKDKTAYLTEPDKEIASPRGPESRIAVDKEEQSEAILDDSLDAGDEDMQPILGGADRLTTIVEGLDTLSKAQALRGEMQKQPLELAEYLTRIVERTRGSVPDKHVTFNLECENGLQLTADPDCLTGIMANLLDNAAKAVKNEGTVTMSAAAEGEHIVFAVRDTGTGIRRKDLPHIFEQFYRASGNGIGLGLTIAQELVDACGGQIEVQTTRGKGSLFLVRIPLS